MTGEDDKSGEAGKARELKISIDTKNMEDMMARLKKAEEKNDELQKQFNEANLAKTTAEEAKKTAEIGLETKTSELDDAVGKLTLIAEQRLTEKKKIIMDKAKEAIKDPERLKKIEEGMKNPEEMKRTEYMIETLANALTEGEKQHNELIEAERKKLLGADVFEKFKTDKIALLAKFPDAKDKIDAVGKPSDLETLVKELTGDTGGSGGESGSDDSVGKGGAGQISLPDSQVSGGDGEGYSSHQAMLYDLRKKAHNPDPVIAANAQSILDEIWRKWSISVKERYSGQSPKGLEIKPVKQPTLREITKGGGESVRSVSDVK